MRATILAGLAGFALLSACEATTDSTVRTPAGDLSVEAVEANAPPLGSAKLDMTMAAMAFQSICVDTLPDFRGAAAAVREQGYAQNPATGTWYHPNVEASVSLAPRNGHASCSFIFASDDDPAVLGLALSVAAAGGGTPSIGVDPTSGASMTVTEDGSLMTFEPLVAGRRDLHHAYIVALR